MGSVASMYFLGKIEFSLIRQSWLTWWIRDTLGVYIGTPFILFGFKVIIKYLDGKNF